MERAAWRKNTVIMLDGAYHAAQATKDLIAKLKVPIMMLEPHSYDAAPCELFFAVFKRDDINPRHVATDKSHFKDVVELVVKRCLEIHT